MEEIYRSCPEFENNDYILRMVRQEDRLDVVDLINYQNTDLLACL